MSLFFRRKPRAAARSDQWVYPRPMYYAGGGGYNDIDLSSMESSLQSIAVRATVDMICSLVSELPIDVFSGRGANKRQITTPGYLLDPAGDGHGAEDWIYQLLESLLLRGNVFGDVLDIGPGNIPRQIDLMHPDHVRGQLEDGRVSWTLDGRPVGRMWHRRAFPVPGAVLGLSPIQAHASDLGLNLTLTRWALTFFKDGAHPGAVLTNTEKEVGEALSRQVKDRFMAATRGNREPAVMGKGWKYEPITINPEESQFLETRGFSAAECCRIFGPGYAEILGYQQSGSTLTYANLQSRATHILVFSLGKWIRRADRWLSEMLPRPQYVRLNRDALLETTTLERFQAHALANAGKPWRTVNETRRIEDLEPIDGGDELAAPAPPAPPQQDPAADGGDNGA